MLGNLNLSNFEQKRTLADWLAGWRSCLKAKEPQARENLLWKNQ